MELFVFFLSFFFNVFAPRKGVRVDMTRTHRWGVRRSLADLEKSQCLSCASGYHSTSLRLWARGSLPQLVSSSNGFKEMRVLSKADQYFTCGPRA